MDSVLKGKIAALQSSVPTATALANPIHGGLVVSPGEGNAELSIQPALADVRHASGLALTTLLTQGDCVKS